MTRLLSRPLLSTAELRSRGFGAADIARAVREERLWQVHRGWYAEPGTDAQMIRAMRAGGRIGCVSALRLYGSWCPPDSGLHIAMPASSSGRRLARSREDGKGEDVTAHWGSKLTHQEWSTGASTIERALGHLLECQPAHYSVAVLDSLLHRRVLSTRTIEKMTATLPPHRTTLLSSLDERSEEGIESIARFRLLQSGIRAVPQVVVGEIGRVDLLIGERLVIELDGRETHAQREAFTKDRRRTALLTQGGYTVLHFSYAQVIYDWNLILTTIQAALSLSR
ncbi:hypothetical protein DDQ50_04915 [Amnibacterium flavum]|uniref:DUF559 domain-containing protein n=2 Tax=Amnibacterium flavum TaxID=2173173 RepID=A0A2V1HTC0_9MICO|nr:hypothetical protein DDQ50_04915 [Amnibacterium flavum]